MDTRAEAGYARSWMTGGTSGEKTVTEAEWMTCTDPQPMLEFLRGKASDRKLRLFAVACCRSIWHLFTDKRSQRGIELAEAYASSEASYTEFRLAGNSAREAAAMGLWQEQWGEEACTAAASACCEPMSIEAATLAAREAVGAATEERLADEESDLDLDVRMESGRIFQSHLVRDIFGNPFRPVAVDPSWLVWHDVTISRIAQAVYDERAFDKLPKLAHALEKAGCQDQDILDHCRQPGIHTKGCWLVDLLLGKS